MREGWEVWLLPNQATGKQGVPRYIKVDPATDPVTESGEVAAASGVDTTEPDPEQVRCYFQRFCRTLLVIRISDQASCCLFEDS